MKQKIINGRHKGSCWILTIVSSKVLNSKTIAQRYNNKVVFQIAQNQKFCLFKVQISNPGVHNSKLIATAISVSQYCLRMISNKKRKLLHSLLIHFRQCLDKLLYFHHPFPFDLYSNRSYLSAHLKIKYQKLHWKESLRRSQL